MNINKASIAIGIFFAMTSIILGAFGAHYLKTIFTPELLNSFETGVKYQFYHALALIISGILQAFLKKSTMLESILFSLGIVLFSGSIYALTVLKSAGEIGLGGLGVLTPTGGVLFIAAWLLLLIKVLRSNDLAKSSL